jgi:hypothetical protein
MRMAIVLALTGLLLGSAFFVAEAVRRAPEGYEDREGFHFGRTPSTSFGTASSEAEFVREPSQNVA